MSVKEISTSFVQSFNYTNNILPHTQDATWKKVAKWAIILLSLGSVFLVTLFLDLTKKIISKLSLRNAPPHLKTLTTYEKIEKFFNRFWDGLKEGLTETVVVSNFFATKRSPYNRFGLTSGYIIGTTGLFYLGERLGISGAATALSLTLLGICIKPLDKHVWQPLQKKFHSSISY